MKGNYTSNATIFFAILSFVCIICKIDSNADTGGAPLHSERLLSAYIETVSSTQWFQSDAPTSFVDYLGIAVDDTGQYVVAVSSSSDDGIYRSSNYGLHWEKMPNAPVEDWRSITSDSTGQYLAAIVENGFIYQSNDSGSSWNVSGAPFLTWHAITSDSTGQFLVAIGNNVNTFIYISMDYGLNWMVGFTPPFEQYNSVCSDGSGQLVYATSSSNGIVVSSANYGLNWTTTAAPRRDWMHIACDDSGQYLTAAASGQGIYTSSDYGVTWQLTSAPALSWQSVASDASGRNLVAVAPTPNGGIYNSKDFGASWTQTDSAQNYWYGVASDASGQYLTATTSVLAGIFTTAGEGGTYKPSALPTIAPSMQPTSQPSSQPSAQPSAFPTYVPGAFESTLSVVSQNPAAQTMISNLGTGGPVYVTANLLLSYLSEQSGGYVVITAGAGGNVQVVSPQCAPVAACSSGSALVSTYCAVNMDVTAALTSQNGGSLQLTAVTNTQHVSGANPQLCNRLGIEGIYFEVNYTVSTFRQPTFAPTRQPTVSPTTPVGTVVINKNSALVTSGGAPFYVIGMAMAAFAALGVVVVRQHDATKGLTPLRLPAVCFDMALQGNIVVSEIFYIIVLLQSASGLFKALAMVLIAARLQNALCGGYLLYLLYTPATQLYEKLNKEVLLLHPKLHAGLQMLMIFDCAMFRYLPWMESELTFQSMHFPTPISFKLCMATRVLQSGTALVVQAVVLWRFNRSDLDDDYTLGLLVLILVMTSIVFVSIVLTIVMHLRELKSPPGQSQDGTAGRRFDSSNPLHALELAVLGTSGTGEASVLEERMALLEHQLAEQKTRTEQQEAQRMAQDEKIAALSQQIQRLAEKVNNSSNKGLP